MELHNESLRTVVIPNNLYPSSLKEIDERLRRRYLDRLGQKVKKLRKLFVERNWEELRNECGQLANSGVTFGFEHLTELAIAAQEAIPIGKVSKAATPLYAKETAEALITTIDSILIENTVPRA